MRIKGAGEGGQQEGLGGCCPVSTKGSAGLPDTYQAPLQTDERRNMFHTIKAIILVVFFTGITGTGAYYLYQYKTLDMQNQILTTDLEICEGDGIGLKEQILVQNDRIEAYNARTLAIIEQAQLREDKLKAIITAQEGENRWLQNEIGNFRKYTQQVKENDKEFADWTDKPMPTAGWRLLQQATEAHRSD